VFIVRSEVILEEPKKYEHLQGGKKEMIENQRLEDINKVIGCLIF
jgi:hypothetical protein